MKLTTGENTFDRKYVLFSKASTEDVWFIAMPSYASKDLISWGL